MSKTILLADDSVTIQKVIELTFMDEDYEVVSASDGEQALERLDTVTPDVVIADVHMPGASGFDVAKRAKQHHPRVPVLLLVGTFEPFDEADFEGSGADAFLKKPFDSQELLQRVNGLLAAAPAAAGSATAAPAPAASREEDADFVLEEDPTYGADEPLLTPEPEPAVSPVARLSAPTESLLPAVDEDEDGGWGSLREEAPQDETPPWELRSRQAQHPAPAGSDLGTRAIPGLAGREEARPAPPPPPAAEGDTTDPFPELAASGAATRASRRDDLFGGLDEADGSSEVKPPADLAGDDFGDDESDEVDAFDASEDRDGGGLDAGGLGTDGAEASTLAAPPSEAPRLVGEPPQAVRPPSSSGDAGGWKAPAPERPVQVPPAPAAPVADGDAAEGGAAAAAGGLSDQDVDRIARRVVELLGQEVLREVAWEVVPDLAEVVIKDRLRELESQVEEN